MQTVSRYLITNLVNATISGYHGRGSAVYDRRLKLYRGVYNPITFTFKNEDQKAQNVSGRNYEFNLIDSESKKSVITRKLDILDDGSTLTTKGQARVTLSDGDLLPLDAKFYNYSVRENLDDGSTLITYADTGYTVSGTAEILDGAYPEMKDSIVIDSGFTSTGPTTRKTSSAIDAGPGQNNNSALHTVAVYGTVFTGNFRIEGSLSGNINSTPDPTDWVRISSNAITTLTGITYYNFTGVYVHVRFSYDNDSGNVGTIDKILYRH